MPINPAIEEKGRERFLELVDLEIVSANVLASALMVASEFYQLGVSDENKRLQEVAQDYRKKGFELETFIYSGFIADLEDML